MLESLKLGLYQTFILDDNYQYFIKGLGTTLTVTIFALVLRMISSQRRKDCRLRFLMESVKCI